MAQRKKRKRKVAKGRVVAAIVLALVGILLILLGTWALLRPEGTGLIPFSWEDTTSQTSQTEVAPPEQEVQPQPVLAVNPLTGTQT